MLNRKTIVAGYAGIKLTKAEWLHTFLDDARILRKLGRDADARILEQYAANFPPKRPLPPP